MVRLGSLSDASIPVFTDLGAQATNINNVVRRLGPFSQAAIPAVESLGEAAKTGIPAVTDARPVIADLRQLANAVRPVGATAADLLESFQKTQGIERLMDYIFYQTTAINGFDALGHYLRAELVVNQCVNYAVRPVNGCSSNFSQSSAAAAATSNLSAAVGNDPVLQRTAQALAEALGQAVEKEKKKHTKKAKRHGVKHEAKRKHRKTEPASPTPGPDTGVTESPTGPVPTPTAAAPAPSATAPAETPTPAPTQSGAGDALLDYLFGGDG